MKKTKKPKKSANTNIVTRKLNAFMNGMENNDMRDVVSNLQAVIEYREEELRIYRKKYFEDTGKDRPDLTDDERRSMARKGKALNSCLLSLVGDSWSTQTALSWYKTLIADKHNSVAPGWKKRGRKRIPKELSKVREAQKYAELPTGSTHNKSNNSVEKRLASDFWQSCPKDLIHVKIPYFF